MSSRWVSASPIGYRAPPPPPSGVGLITSGFVPFGQAADPTLTEKAGQTTFH
jgi:hypothetical protein